MILGKRKDTGLWQIIDRTGLVEGTDHGGGPPKHIRANGAWSRVIVMEGDKGREYQPSQPRWVRAADVLQEGE